MAVKIKFDSANNAEQPTFVLATRNGRFIGKLPVSNLQFKDSLNSVSTARFNVNYRDVASIDTKEFVHINGFDLYSEVSANGTSCKIGEIQSAKYDELKKCFENSDSIINSTVRIINGSTVDRYDNLELSMVGSTLFISDSSNNIISSITNNGNVYLHNVSLFGYHSGDYLKVMFSFSYPSSDSSRKLWEQIRDFKLVWVREWNSLFEITVEVNDNGSLTKIVTANSLGESELSQINLYGCEINTEEDIEREDYVPTVLYDENSSDASLLNRILEKAPHYEIKHVDASIAGIQRTFSFDGKSIYDALQDISQEINCLFVLKCYINNAGNIAREISAYDIESYCLDCGHRGEFSGTCEDCGSSNILNGYGEDTTIFITDENLANEITLSTNTGAIKNCFRLEAGDDLMTATITNCNPNGTPYIWYISEETKKDMSIDLVERIDEYNQEYDYYQNYYSMSIDSTLRSAYNALIDKYNLLVSGNQSLPQTIVGYPDLMMTLYNVIDFYILLHDTLMPNATIPTTSASLEAAKLTTANLSPVSVQNISSVSLATATNAVLQMAKTIVDGRYQVKISNNAISGTTWSGTFTVTSYADEEDTASTSSVNVTINDDYENFVKQKIDKILSKKSEDEYGIVALFSMNAVDFKDELEKYCLTSLNSFKDCCQSCIDILIEQGIADRETWANQNPDLYTELYLPYYEKLGFIEDEIEVRSSEIALISGEYDAYGNLVSDGVQTVLENERKIIHDALDFNEYLGNELGLEFASYRRDDTYKNDNYISDGLNNAELFANALEFIETAKKEIYRSSNSQHEITASLKNLLVIRDFLPIVDHFEVGNWLRIKLNNHIYKLRLVDYTIDFEKPETLSVTFSDVSRYEQDGSFSETIRKLDAAQSMSSTYGYVSRQAGKGKESNDKINDWVNQGLSLTKMKIIDTAENQNITWDNHGILCKEYLPITDTYDDKQLKIINRGLYLTDDNWLTSKAGIGNFTYYNPESGNMEEAYGVIADTLIGNLILSEKVGVYNKNNSISLGENGIIITTDDTQSGENQMAFTIRKKGLDNNNQEFITNMMYIDSDGNLVLNGSININTSSDDGISTLDELTDVSRFTATINDSIYRVLNVNDESITVFVTDANGNIIFDENGNPLTQEVTVNGLYSKIDAQYTNSVAYTQYMLNSYKAEVSQYMTFDSENGLTLGATGSSFKTVIDNMRMAFWDGNTVAAYISNSQLYIPSAVIENTLTLGDFFFSPRSDGGVSLTWQGN